MHVLGLLQVQRQPKRAPAALTPLAAAAPPMEQEGGVLLAGVKPPPQQPFISCLSATVQIGHVPSEGEMLLKRQRIPLSDTPASYLRLVPTGHLRLKCFLLNQKEFLPYYSTASFPLSNAISFP